MNELKRDPETGHLDGIEQRPAPKYEHQEYPKWVDGVLCENAGEEESAKLPKEPSPSIAPNDAKPVGDTASQDKLPKWPPA